MIKLVILLEHSLGSSLKPGIRRCEQIGYSGLSQLLWGNAPAVRFKRVAQPCSKMPKCDPLPVTFSI